MWGVKISKEAIMRGAIWGLLVVAEKNKKNNVFIFFGNSGLKTYALQIKVRLT